MDNRPPSVDALARRAAATGLPHPVLVDAARAALARGTPDSVVEIAEAIRAAWLRPVINATGVLLHTNMGRAPVGGELPASYTNLELDVASGRRGSRADRIGDLLASAGSADAALVVNNCAAAVVLVLAALAAGERVAVSRGELVEIGGGFRLPDVMRQAGVLLTEVGTTNRTRASDFADVADEVALLLRVHRSNFEVTGFVEEPTVSELAGLAPPLVVDLGSGLLDAACPWLPTGPPSWLKDEPAVRQTLAAGADLVLISGDKLFGGPQAGIILGRAELIARCRQHPLYRVLRPGTAIVSLLQDTALAYLRRDASSIPFWRMATVDCATLRRRAEALDVGDVVECQSVPGGGTLPGVTIDSVGLSLPGDVTPALRHASPRPIIARVADDRTVLDLRTVDPSEDAELGAAVRLLTP